MTTRIQAEEVEVVEVADDEETKLLVSLHATIEDQNVYEENVVREVTKQQIIPSLSDAAVIPAHGFPDLSLLITDLSRKFSATPSGNNSSTAIISENILILLKKIQNQINDDENMMSEDEMNLLCMKEQMLLVYLSQHNDGSNYNDLPYQMDNSDNERRKRKTRISTTDKGGNNNTIRNINGENHQRKRRIPMMKRKAIANFDDDRDTKIQKEEYNELSKEEFHHIRMERQKRKEERRNRKRRKRKVLIEPSEESDENEFDNEIKQDKTSTEAVDEANNNIGDLEKSNTIIIDITIQDDNHEETMIGNNENGIKSPAVVDTIVKSSSDNYEVATTVDVDADNNDNHMVICPLCNCQLHIPNISDIDSQLAQHMMECQNNNTRPSRRSRNNVVNYNLDNDYIETTRTTSNTINQIKRKQKSKTDNGIVEVSVPSHAKKMKKKKSEVVVEEDIIISKPLHLDYHDDMNEWVYEDRVDEWIDNGINQMKIMNERDEQEELPGEEIYNGDLFVPAWVNNHVFGYQRIGLQWMWTLHHEKECGGIIGDEMGLGKTVQVSAFLGLAAASRKLKSILIMAPATMLQHWLNELAIWAPGLRRVLVHQSSNTNDSSTSPTKISKQLLQYLDKWLFKCRKNRVNEPIDEDDINTTPSHTFCGTGYVIITTYENVRRYSDIYTTHEWSYVVLDEAQKIRNPDADITLTCKRLRTPHRLAITGTPIQNDLKELWSLFDFVYPGRLGTLPAFEQEFATPIRRGGYSNASPMHVQLAYRCAVILKDTIEPYMLRRLKKDVKEVSRMPGKTEHILFCRLTSRQRDMYESYLKSDDVARVIRGSSQMFSAVTTLRKISNHPDLVCDPKDQSSFETFVRGTLHKKNKSKKSKLGTLDDSSIDDDDFDNDNKSCSYDINNNDNIDSFVHRSGKLEVLSKILPLWKRQGHRVLIFCQWKKMLNIIQQFVIQMNWKYSRLDGNTIVSSRQRLVDTFNHDDTYFIMLCTTRTGGVGLNLTGANRIILYDPDWNPSTDQQARERVWRFGQKRDVTIYRLITAGTIEEKIYHRQIFKTALSNKVLQDPQQRRLFSTKDLKDLFTLSADTKSVSSGGNGITETSRATKGIGIVDRVDECGGINDDNDDNAASDNDEDNEATLRQVMKSKGLAGIFDHHSIENDPNRKTTTVREMEEQAKKIAKDALKALEESVANNQRFIPTWTGSDESQQLFGTSSLRKRETDTHHTSHPTGGMSSTSLLATLKAKKQKVEEETTTNTQSNITGGDNHNKYLHLCQKLMNFIREQSPVTEDILEEFNEVPGSDVAIFRRLLKSIAYLENGRWFLK